MTEYNKIQVDYRDESKKKIARQMEIAGSAVTDDELERMLEGGDGAMLMGHVKIEGNEDQLRYGSFSINVDILNFKIGRIIIVHHLISIFQETKEAIFAY